MLGCETFSADKRAEVQGFNCAHDLTVPLLRGKSKSTLSSLKVMATHKL